MSKSNKIRVINLNNYELMTNNIETVVFLNGDPIPEAKTNEEWEKAGKENEPVWCYFKNDHFKNRGKLYNWYAVNDSRGICPLGFHVPSSEEWKNLVNFNTICFAKIESKIKRIINSLIHRKPKLSVFPIGYRSSNGKFSTKDEITVFWSSSSHDKKNAYCCFFYHNDKTISNVPYAKDAGFSIRCLKNK